MEQEAQKQTHTFKNLVYYSNGIADHWENYGQSINGARTIDYQYGKIKLKLSSYLTLYIKSNLKDLMWKRKILKLLEENIREQFCGLGVGQDFLGKLNLIFF